MPSVRIEASEAAVQWAKDICQTENASLDSLSQAYRALQAQLAQAQEELAAVDETPTDTTPEILMQGDPADCGWIELECQRVLGLARGTTITFAEVRQALASVVESQALMIARSVMGSTGKKHTLEECAAAIIRLCPYDIEEHFVIAEETWSHAGITLGRAQIIASVLLADRNRLNAGDITELRAESAPAGPSSQRRPVSEGPHICPAEEMITIVDEELGPQSIRVPLCGKPFTPSRLGVKYGCNACGEIAHKARIWLTESIEQVRRKTLPTIQAAPTFRIPGDLKDACTCGQTPSGTIMHAA